MTQVNGHDQEALDTAGATVADDIKELAGRIREQGLSVVERVNDHGTPFDQKTHTLMMESVDRITQHWVGELDHVRRNTQIVEQMVVAQAAKAKDELTKLHLLGTQAMKEAQRGQDVVQHLGDELDAMMADHGGTH